MSTYSSEVDAALLQHLEGVPAVQAHCPDGVFWDLAKPGSSRFVIVSLSHHEETYVLGGTQWESFLYLVKAVVQSSSSADIKPAAAAIHDALQDTRLAVAGLEVIFLARSQYVRFTERDETTDLIWQHRGGLYHLLAAPAGARRAA